MSIKSMSDYVFYAKYAKYNPEKGRRETWSETVNRVFDMHEKHLKQDVLHTDTLPDELSEYMDLAKLFLKQKRVLGSQRALQFGGDPILKKNAKIYNCSATYADRPRVFQEILYLLLCGCGVGASIQKHHIENLPKISKHSKGKCRWVIDDSIEGWSDALGVLLQSYFVEGQTGEFDDSIIGKDIDFDYGKIRPAGSMISGGFLAPGPHGLHQSLDKIKEVIERRLDAGEDKLHPIDVYDILMHAADAVLSGGVRRSAMIILFSKDDEEMLKAKTGNWFETNPQRGRSNNSVILKRDDCSEDDFKNIIESIKEFGEPGFVFVDDYEMLVNPCCFVGDTKVITKDGELPIKEIVDNFDKKPYYVYSLNDANMVEVRRIISAKLTKKNAEVVEGHFSDGTIIVCTPDHKFLTTKGYKEFKDLTEEDDVITTSSLTHLLSKSEHTPEDVYDIEVEANHNFFANGLCVHNCEISMVGHDPITGESGVSFCNLCEINMKKAKTEEDFFAACKAAAVIGTIQASYTRFDYLTPATKNIVDKEALLGVSLTGMMDNPDISFNPKVLTKGAKIVKKVNKHVAKLIGINPSARATCTKPSGTASLILGSGSGIHPHHAKRYIRRIQANVHEFPLQKYEEVNPIAVEPSVWSNTGTDKVIMFPCEVPAGSITKNQLSAIDLLEKVKLVQQNWVEPGTEVELCLNPTLRHNVSNTISVKPEEWDIVAKYLYENRKFFTGVSLLSVFGDKDLPQTPLTTIYTAEEIAKQYGSPCMFASGLIVHAHKAFKDNLWRACNCALGLETIDKDDECQKKWLERLNKFANKYFDGDIRRVTYLLKDVDNLKLWCDLVRSTKEINWAQVKEPDPYKLAIDTTAAAGCAGGKCEWTMQV